MSTTQANIILQQIRRLAARGYESPCSDGELLERFCRTADASAFEELLRRHGPMVLRVCRRLLPQSADAEDVFQATFLTLIRKAGSIRRRDSAGAWLHGVAYCLARKLRRTQSHRVTCESQARQGSADDPLEEITLREALAVMDEELARLPERLRGPLILCYLEGQTSDAAARQLGWSRATIQRRLARGRDVLAKRLTRRGLALSTSMLGSLLADQTAKAALAASSVVQAAVLVTKGQSVAGVLTARAVDLADAAVQFTVGAKSKLLVVVVLALGVATGAGLSARHVLIFNPAENKQAEQPTGVENVPPASVAASNRRPRTDPMGDPLPPEAFARLGTVRFRHGTGWINAIDFSPDGKQLVSQGSDAIRIWDAATGREVHNLPSTAEAAILSSSSPPGGKFIITIERSQNHAFIRLRAWDDLKLVREFAVEHYISSFCLSPNGKTLAAFTNQNGYPIQLWDVTSGRQLRTWKGHNGYIWCHIFSADGKTLITGGADKVVRFWDVTTGNKKQEIIVPDLVGKITLSADGTLLATLGLTEEKNGAVTIQYPENLIRVWDVAHGKELRQLRNPPGQKHTDHEDRIYMLTFAPNGKTLLSVANDGVLRFRDAVTGKELRHFPIGLRGQLSFALSPDGKRLALAGGTISVIDLASGKGPLNLPGHQLGISETCFMLKDKTVATSSYEQAILLWEAATGRQQNRLETGECRVEAMRSMDHGRTLLSTGSDKMIRIWDAVSGREVRHFPAPEGRSGLLDLSPDEKLLALTGPDKGVAIMDIATTKELHLLKEHDVYVSGGTFSPDGANLTVWCGDYTVHRWDLASGRKVGRFSFDTTGTPAIPGGGSNFYAYIAAASPDGKLIAHGSQQRYLVLHELPTGKVVRRLENLPDGVSAVAFSPDSKMLAWGGWQDPTIHLVEVATGRERHHLLGHKGRITSLTISGDGQALVSGGQDTAAMVWDLTGKLGSRDKWGGPLSAADLNVCWKDLADLDAAQVYKAMRRLAASSGDSVPFLAKLVEPVAIVDQKRLSRLITDLDSSEFAVRENAQKELEILGELAAPACRRALKDKPSAEARRRLAALIDKQTQEELNSPPGRLRALRTIETLEHIGAGAREVLVTLANGAPESRLTQEAKASLERLAKHVTKTP